MLVLETLLKICVEYENGDEYCLQRIRSGDQIRAYRLRSGGRWERSDLSPRHLDQYAAALAGGRAGF